VTPEIDLLRSLVSIPSPSRFEDAACSFLERALPSFGWDRVSRDGAGSVVAERGKGGRELVFLCHIDTVPGGPDVRIDADVLWGRGSVDAKGPLCAAAVAGGRVELPEGWRMTLVAAVGEEDDSRGARFRLGLHRPAGCVVGEPSGTDGVTIGYRGMARVSFTAADSGAHRSGDAGPQTACLTAAAEMISAIRATDDPSRPVIERPSVAVCLMEGVENGGRRARIDLDVRIPLDKGGDPLASLGETAAKHGVNGAVLSRIEAAMTEPGDPLVRAFRVSVRKAGRTPRLLAKGGTADFNLAAAWGCPMIAYGPGDSRLDHTAEERLDLRDYVASIGILSYGVEEFLSRAI
jgi:LysW-gamma-L-lysine carboxypeptidase